MEYLSAMANNPSKLESFREFIAAERKKKTTYRRIAELLAEQGVEIDYSTIHAFVKVRSKPPRKVITMWESNATPASPAPQNLDAVVQTPHTTPTARTAPEQDRQDAAIRRLKRAKPNRRDTQKGLPSFQEDAPLDRLSDEEARRLRKKL